jgi:hypothetical protein
MQDPGLLSHLIAWAEFQKIADRYAIAFVAMATLSIMLIAGNPAAIPAAVSIAPDDMTMPAVCT